MTRSEGSVGHAPRETGLPRERVRALPDPRATRLPFRLTGFQVLVLIAAVVACRVLAIHSFPIYDDAFITYRYARNLGEGLGLVYNPGVAWEPVLGTTTPGYSVLLAVLHSIGMHVPMASRAVNLSCDIVSVWLLILLLDRRALASTVAALLFASSPDIARISVGGMEAALLGALALGAVVAGRKGRVGLSGVLAAAACTVRPEAVLLVLALGVSHLGSRRDLVRFAAPVVLIGAVYAAVLAWIYGSPIPQSVQSKAGGSRLPFDPERTAEILRQSFAPSTAALVALPFVALGFVRALRSRAWPFVAFALLIVVSYVASGAKTWGWYYYIPLIAWALALGMGVETAVHWVLERRPGWSPGQRFAAAPAVLALAAVIGVASFTHRFPDRVTTRVYEPLRAWSDAHGVAERRASIVASDIGAIGWFGGLILDTEGLVWPEAKGYANQVAAVNRHLPDYVVLVATRERVLDFMASPVFDRYRPVRRFNTEGDLDLAPSTGSLPEWWRQDYLVYERVR